MVIGDFFGEGKAIVFCIRLVEFIYQGYFRGFGGGFGFGFGGFGFGFGFGGFGFGFGGVGGEFIPKVPDVASRFGGRIVEGSIG